MMYYDRRIGSELVELLAAEGPLSWILSYVRSTANTRFDFRREDGARKHGALQLYVGRTSPLEIVSKAGGRVRIDAHDVYREISPELFGTYDPLEWERVAPALRQHLDAVESRYSSQLTEGEAITHTGLTRCYSLDFSRGDRLVTVDSEVVVGFRGDERYRTGTAHRRALAEAAREAANLSKSDGLPRKLDTIGVLPLGDVALVEVKAEGGDLMRAAKQAAVHVFNFQALMAQDDYDLSRMLNGMIDQKAEIGALPSSAYRVCRSPRLVPVVAAPDADPDWANRWLDQTAAYLERTHLLRGIRFWRLSGDGVVEEEFSP